MFGFKKKKSKLKLSKKKNIVFKYKMPLIAIALFALSIIVFISLISHNPNDKSWFHITTDTRSILNWSGIFGANISAFLFYFLGGAAYIFVLGFPFFAILLFSKKSLHDDWDRLIAFACLVSSISSILRAYNIDFGYSFSGGLIGYYILKLADISLGNIGSKIFLFSIFFSSAIVLFRISLKLLVLKSLWFIGKSLKVLFVYCCKFLKFAFTYIAIFLFNFLKIIYIKIKNYVFKNKSSYLDDEIKEEDEYIFLNAKKVPSIKTEKIKENSSEQVWSDIENIVQENGFVNSDDIFFNKEIFFQSREEFIYKFKMILLPNSCVHKNILSNNLLLNLNIKENNKDDLINKISYDLPDPNMFEDNKSLNIEKKKLLEEESAVKGNKLVEKLKYFGIKGQVTAIRPGPVITLFEYKPEIDSKISRIVSLEDDLAMALTALSIRIVAPIPGRSVVGFEISNKIRQKVFLSNLLESKDFTNFNSKLPIILGVDIVGKPIVQDLAQMPHLLVAGSTGSGKSVGLNSMLVSLLFKFRPDQLKLLLIDPKRLEFAPYKDIPHLLFPIITNSTKAVPVLKWLVQEMEDRYNKMALAGVRNIGEYQKAAKKNDDLEAMPFIVLMIDELADLMMVAGKDIETQIARIAQMARAAGIHMVVATQRPSVDVITGLIKVNFPSRVAFRVSSKIDSRTIVDSSGAEKLLGKGDMLYMNSGSSDLQRVHGAYIGVKEVEKVTSYLRTQGKPEYLDLNETLKSINRNDIEQIEDNLYPEIREFLKCIDEISISALQRKYRIGFNRSARLIERLENDGLVAPAQGSKPRKVLKDNI